jgi:hypothetical protein
MLVTLQVLLMILMKIQVFCDVLIRLLLQTFQKHLHHTSSVSKRFRTVVTRSQDSTIFQLPHPEDGDSTVPRTVAKHTATSS